MNAIELIQYSLGNAFGVLGQVVADLGQEQADWTPPGIANPIGATYWHAIFDTIPAMLRNPGVGMNAGAPPPTHEKSHDISDFSEDVTEQILARDDAVVGAGER